MKKRRRADQRGVEEYVEGILRGNRVILSQAVTLVESSLPAHRDKAQAIIEQCLPHAGNAIRVGITGVPGAGRAPRSILLAYLLDKGHKLAVLAIDPPASDPREASWAIKPAWRNSPWQKTLSYALPLCWIVGRRGPENPRNHRAMRSGRV